jgi:hypothetical protein
VTASPPHFLTGITYKNFKLNFACTKESLLFTVYPWITWFYLREKNLSSVLLDVG